MLSNGVLISGFPGATYQWYTCPNTIITGATSQTYTPTAEGDYKVSITLGGCTVTSSCETVTVLGNASFEFKNKFKIYPNPTTSHITIQFSNLNNAKLEVYDINGRVLQNQNLNSTSNTVDISRLPSGMYLFKVSSDEGSAMTKVIKN